MWYSVYVGVHLVLSIRVGVCVVGMCGIVPLDRYECGIMTVW